MPTPAVTQKASSDLGQFLSIDTVPMLIMERLTDIRNLAAEIRNIKIFAADDPADRLATVESLTFKPNDHPLVQIIKQTAHEYYECKSDSIRRELLSELRELLAEQHGREIQAMKEANRLLIEWAKIKHKKGESKNSSLEESFMNMLKEAAPWRSSFGVTTEISLL